VVYLVGSDWLIDGIRGDSNVDDTFPALQSRGFAFTIMTIGAANRSQTSTCSSPQRRSIMT
jgi:hypothetical protein